jgi:hypothetical protein
MEEDNRITIITRQYIADEMKIERLWYHGNLSEPEFLSRLFDLKKLPSRDYRFGNAYDDIYQHMVNNTDWDENWMYSDSRINLFYCDDELYLKFLSATVHPSIRNNSDEVFRLLDIYNKHLDADGFEIIQVSEISRKPIFGGHQKTVGQDQLIHKKVEIIKYLNTEYVNAKINLMNDAIIKDTDLAIGTAKELLETVCKSILKQKNIVVDPCWTLLQLIKTTTSNLDFTPKQASEPDKAEKAIKQILGGIMSIVHGMAELRNGYGTGHGKDSDFMGLEPKYAKLFVGVTSDIVILYLSTNGETAELVET